MKIKIITDSVCDIPEPLLEKWDITVIPCYVNYGGNSFLDDGVELDRVAYYEQLANVKPYPTTAAPSPGLASEYLRTAFEDADHLLCIHTPQKLSAIYNNVTLAAQEVAPGAFTMVDSETLAINLGVLVLIAAEMVAKNHSLEEIIIALEKVKKNQRLYVAFATLDFVARSGRVNTYVAKVGNLLQIKPIGSVYDSSVHNIARIRTFKRAVDKLESLAREEVPLERLFLLHIRNEEGAKHLRERLSDIAPTYETHIIEVGPTLGSHIGPGSVGVATLRASWRNE